MLYHTHDRADSETKVSVLRHVMECPTEGGLTLLKRLDRDLKGTSDVDAHAETGWLRRGWVLCWRRAGYAGSQNSQSFGKIFADGVLLNLPAHQNSLETRVLWLQHAVRGLVELELVPSDDNLADLGTA